MGWVLAASAAFGVGGAAMRMSSGFDDVVPSVLAVVAFVVGAVLLTVAVRAEGLSVAYTVGLGFEALISVGLGRWVFGERLHPVQLLGVALIVVGTGTVRLG